MTVIKQGSRRLIASACPAAQKVGLIEGMAVVKAQAMVPDLHIINAGPRAR
ncbi:hypothetical protein [Microvirga sesbaniae]|uniref:hypothetical protein n=1 Tax=Microvirga sesbaniae TaxID=681392 RepID=UPI0021CA8D32|nr:hypothetical protein [Microvirga sp. HBU67692]